MHWVLQGFRAYGARRRPFCKYAVLNACKEQGKPPHSKALGNREKRETRFRFVYFAYFAVRKVFSEEDWGAGSGTDSAAGQGDNSSCND